MNQHIPDETANSKKLSMFQFIGDWLVTGIGSSLYITIIENIDENRSDLHITIKNLYIIRSC